MAKEVEVILNLNEDVTQIIKSALLKSCIEYLLYQRQQLPMPYHELTRMMEEQEKQDITTNVVEQPVTRRFLNTEYKNAKKVYEDVECLSDNINKLFMSTVVKSALILLGSTPVSPKERYLLDFQNPEERNSLESTSRICNSSCRKLIRSLISNPDLGTFKDISPTSMFVFIQASRSSHVQWFRPKSSFKPPNRGQSCKISVRTALDEQLNPPNANTDEWLWFQAPVIVRGYRNRNGV